MKIHPIRITDASLQEAFTAAATENEPLLIPSVHYTDDRGWSLMNQLQGVMTLAGQINYSIIYPQIVKAWHRHQNQTDFWIPLHGQMKMGIYRESDNTAWQAVAGEKSPCTVIIPPPLWHGVATLGPESAGLLYYVTQQYNPDQPDEERRPPGSVEGFRWETESR